MSNVFTKRSRNGALLPLRWQDRQGVMHSAEGAEVHPGITLIWTRCGCRDVPDNSAWPGTEQVTCAGCNIKDAA